MVIRNTVCAVNMCTDLIHGNHYTTMEQEQKAIIKGSLGM